jgi:hypothetical protein
MSDDIFGKLAQIMESGDPAGGFDFLAEEFRRTKNYRMLFETRLMRRRMDLGLPLVQTQDTSEFPAEARPAYEQAMVDAARETGGLFLADGEIAKAWPYLRAIGESAPVIAAIEKTEPGEDIDPVIQIAFQEGLHPLKGLDLILKKHGMCRALTSFGMYAVQKDREQCINLLARNLHEELLRRLAYAVEQQEGARPDTSSISELISGRDWLFGDYCSYVDTSHLMSVLQYSPEVQDAGTLRLFHEFCEYGKKLSSQFQMKGHPPFENVFVDYDHYVLAVLGINPEEHVAHFRNKVTESDPEQVGAMPAEALINLLVRLDLFGEALEISLEYIPAPQPPDINCPTALQLCHLAKDYERLVELAKERGDVLSYLAGSLEKGAVASSAHAVTSS